MQDEYAPKIAALKKQIEDLQLEERAKMYDRLTPEQKLAIINYIKSVQHEANPGGAGLGRIGPVSETLVGILVGLGLAVLATLWLGTKA